MKTEKAKPRLALNYSFADLPYCCGGVVLGGFSVSNLAVASEEAITAAGKALSSRLYDHCAGMCVSCVTVSPDSSDLPDDDIAVCRIIEAIIVSAGFEKVHEWTNPNSDNYLNMWVKTAD